LTGRDAVLKQLRRMRRVENSEEENASAPNRASPGRTGRGRGKLGGRAGRCAEKCQRKGSELTRQGEGEGVGGAGSKSHGGLARGLYLASVGGI